MKNAAETSKNITNDDVRSILRVLSEYKEGKFIYPGYLAKDLGMDIYRIYEILDSIRDAGYLEMIYEIKGKVNKKYGHLSTIPDGKITEAYVIYKLKTKMNFGKELDNDKSIPLNGKRFY